MLVLGGCLRFLVITIANLSCRYGGISMCLSVDCCQDIPGTNYVDLSVVALAIRVVAIFEVSKYQSDRDR